MSLPVHLLRFSLRLFAYALLTLIVGMGFLYYYVSYVLPDVETLKDVRLQVPMRVYAKDGQLLAEYGVKRRIPVTLDQIPKPLIQAVLATEDQRYYDHLGVDPVGLSRAAVELFARGHITQGGSTITMQVARNFFLTRKKSFSRKFNEILLAIKIDREFSKEKILELYLNQIYLGHRAYGVAAAAQIYYGKTLDQLTLAEMAMIAGLPQAPSHTNPFSNPEAALKRRNHVLERMFDRGDIDIETYRLAVAMPSTAIRHDTPIGVRAPYVNEMARSFVVERYGHRAYSDGLEVHTTIEPSLQKLANQSLKESLLAYDQRHGYRGPVKNIGHFSEAEKAHWQVVLQAIPTVNGLQAAAVTHVKDKSIEALLADGQQVVIPWSQLSWATRRLKNGYRGTRPSRPSDVARIGDVIRVDQDLLQTTWRMTQIPEVEGALVSVDPNNGSVLAVVGGFSFSASNFNRVVQAYRQAGSSFKPFIYCAALAQGMELASVINDAPIVMEDPSLDGLWRPVNDSGKFYGPTRLREGLTHSRNLVSIRLLRAIGIPYALDYISHFGFNPAELPHTLSLALGTGTVTPLQLATGYAAFANGGFKIDPYLVDHIKDADGKVLYQADPKIACASCVKSDINVEASTADVALSTSTTSEVTTMPLNAAERVVDPQVNYLMVSVLQDVIRQGTGQAAKALNRPDIAGKTGTTNEMKDAWFAGFNPDLVTVTWVGFDKPRSLREHGAQAALPMWIDFMRAALADKPVRPLPRPPGLVAVRIDPTTGNPTQSEQVGAIFEWFREKSLSAWHQPATTGSHESMTSEAPESEKQLLDLF